MKLYFSGFSLDNEQKLFDEYSIQSDFVIAGFSFGAIQALEYALETSKRVDTLQLFSPAYFNDKNEKFKRLQLLYFQKNPNLYCDNFLKSAGFEEGIESRYFSLGSYEELHTLLYYEWSAKKLEQLVEKNINIEVYLGAADKIVNASAALEFFREYSEVYYSKNKGHRV